MGNISLIHLMFILIWFGLVLAETVIEFFGNDDESLRYAARLHYWIDILLEIPTVSGVLFTGIILTTLVWPISWILLIKIILGLIAIAANFYCLFIVIWRKRGLHDPLLVRRLSHRIRTLWVAVPAGLGALALGLIYF